MLGMSKGASALRLCMQASPPAVTLWRPLLPPGPAVGKGKGGVQLVPRRGRLWREGSSWGPAGVRTSRALVCPGLFQHTQPRVGPALGLRVRVHPKEGVHHAKRVPNGSSAYRPCAQHGDDSRLHAGAGELEVPGGSAVVALHALLSRPVAGALHQQAQASQPTCRGPSFQVWFRKPACLRPRKRAPDPLPPSPPSHALPWPPAGPSCTPGPEPRARWPQKSFKAIPH